MEEGVKRRLVELATSAKEMATTKEWEKGPWLAQLEWTLKKAGKSRGVVSSIFFIVIFAQATLRCKNKKNLNLNTTRCKYQKTRRGSVLSLLLHPVSYSVQRVSTQILQQRWLELRQRQRRNGQIAYRLRSEDGSDPWSAPWQSAVGLGRDDISR